MHTRVNHKFFFTLIFLLTILAHAPDLLAGTALLSWSPPTENADGSMLSDLAGYNILYGTEPGNYTHNIDVGNVTTYEILGLTSGKTYYFAVLAYDLIGNESNYSIEGSKYIQDTTPVTYYCDSDSDSSINASANGVCTGIGCQPAGCVTSPGNDCNDNNSAVHPGASDSDCNGIDNNCDGIPDNNYVSEATACGTGVCQSSGQRICINGTVEDTCISGDPAGDDSDCNGIDDNCDGLIDNHYVTSISSCGTGVCSSLGQISCTDGIQVDSCTPGAPDEQVETTTGDGLDNDCDGLVDEGTSAKVDISRVIMAEDFSDGIPEFWTAEGSWNTENSCGQVIDQPFSGSYVIADSSCSETGIDTLITAPFDTTGCNTATLAFSNQYFWYSGSVEVDISSDGGTTWSNHLYMENDDNYPTPAWKEIDLGTVTESDKTLVNFKYSNDSASGYWAIDNIWVTCKSAGLDFSSHINMLSSPESLLISNTGSDSLSIDAVEIEGADSSEFTLDSADCLHNTLLPGENCMIDVEFTPGSDGAKNAAISITTNDPANPLINILLTGTANAAVPPAPVIRLNGLEHYANVKKNEPVTLTVELDPKSYINEDADWWILMKNKNRWHYYSAQSGNWRRGNSLYQQAPLKHIGPLEVLNTSNMQKGEYTFYIGVDTIMNGLQDLNNYYFDSITVNIE